jgi:hypothetical protein
MPSSPIRHSLYRSARLSVICVLLGLTFVQAGDGQGTRKGKEKTPRALGLLELAPDGKARLIPIAIMVDGKFYDASAYKASPVPLALWSETVYEAERNGVSQGLFTVRGAARAGNNWFAEGKWQPAGSEPAKPRRTESKPALDPDEGPPKLRRPDAQKPQAPETPAPSAPPPTPQAKAPEPVPSDAGASIPTTSTKPAPSPDISENPSSANDTDPNRPVLQRGKKQTLGSTQPGLQAKATGKAESAATGKATDKKPTERKATQLIPAISDAAGPDPRPYAYDIKPDEEQKFRQKMLAMASEAVEARARQLSPKSAVKPAARASATGRKAPKTPSPSFDDIQFRAFDLWNTNEPVFVLSARAQMPKDPGKDEPSTELTYFVTLVAKADMYGELRKLQTSVTDDHHLDETPRLELVDAVDADGDGRGEFLFRQISDVGSTWAVYRAGSDSLLPLFQGTLSSSRSEPREE